MKTKLSERLAFGAGGFALEIITATLSAYLMLYHTNVLGISAMASGTMFLVARAVDAVTDVVMANIADQTRTKWGTYRPYLLFGAVPIGIVFALNFNAPAFILHAGGAVKLVWAYITYLLAGSIMATVCGVPFGSLNSVMSTDRYERTVFGAARSIGGKVAYFTQSMVMPIVIAFGTVNTPMGWRMVGVLFGLFGTIGFLICFAGTKEKVALPPKGESVPLSTKMKALGNNGPLYGCAGILICYILMFTYFNTFANYFCIYYAGHPAWTAPFSMIRTICAIGAALMIPSLTKRFEKRHIICGGAILCVISFVVLYFVTSFSMMLVSMVVYGIGYGSIMTNVYAMIPEVSDYGEWKNHVSAPAFVYAVCMFALKVASGLASYFVGACLELVGFDAALQSQSIEVQNGIHLWAAVGPMIFAGIIILLTLLMRKLDRKNLNPIIEELDARRVSGQ